MTTEEISREAAEGLVHVARYHDTANRPSWKIWIGILDYSRDFYSDESVNLQAGHVRMVIAEGILAAIRREGATAPVPSPVSEARLAGIRATLHQADEHGYALHRDHVRDLLDHVEHQARLIAFLMGEPEGEAGRALLADAYRRGAQAQRKVCARAADRAAFGAGEAYVVRAVEDAPLATPEGGDDA